MFFSKSADAFYDAAFHGARRISVIDPGWVRPLKTVVLQPGESITIENETIINTVGAVMSLPVPDMDAVPATIEINNPDCKIPTDAREITSARHAELLHGQSEGKRIIGDEDGFPVLADPLPPTTGELWEAVKRERDRRRVGGFKVMVGSAAKWFHSDADSRIQHLELKDKARDILAAGGALGDKITILGQSVKWKTMDGSFVEITAQLAFDIVSAAGDLDAKAFAVAETHRATMESSADPSKYDFSAGWPETFADGPAS